MIVSGDNGLPLFGIAGVERLGYYTTKVHEVQTISGAVLQNVQNLTIILVLKIELELKLMYVYVDHQMSAQKLVLAMYLWQIGVCHKVLTIQQIVYVCSSSMLIKCLIHTCSGVEEVVDMRGKKGHNQLTIATHLTSYVFITNKLHNKSLHSLLHAALIL